MQKWLIFATFVLLLAIPFSARAQGEITFTSVDVQLWPEYDQPNMLVIIDFTPAPGISLPADATIRIPLDAELFAVAYYENGELLYAPSQEPVVEGDWQLVRFSIEALTVYRIEYYAPLTRTDSQRQYTYLWPGDYAVSDFSIRVQVPVDTPEITTDPVTSDAPLSQDGLAYKVASLGSVPEGQQVPVFVQYTKTSDRLTWTTSGQQVQADAVDENTTGRVSFENYLPYILGGVGILLIVVGGIYFWQSGRGKSSSRRRHHPSAEEPAGGEQIYCHQCGKRAQPSDRFCRTCGTRLRRDTA